ncbi:MAG: class I SAM-dependent methyltransferase [archaeon GB-1867-035]|nr:class I SAM-dependent methyltransferase [Candidatus Culexmicrobium profundum]
MHRARYVKDYYEAIALDEDKRLFRDAYHRLEFIITLHYLKKYLDKYFPDGGKVLDCGCGSGHYSLALAEIGFDIVLVDLSFNLLKIARKRFLKRNLDNHAISFMVASSTNLNFLPDNFFDVVLCFGPLYHLIEPTDRVKTISEIRRVLRDNGLLFISAVSLFGVFGVVIKEFSWEFKDEKHGEMFISGVHRAE